MAASYPNAPRAFVPRVDRVDINASQDINDLQEEVVAAQVVLGRNPNVSPNYAATNVAGRLALLEADLLPRLLTVEQRLRRAAVTTSRAAALLVNSNATWQNIILPDVLLTLNDYGTPAQLYDVSLGRFYSVAPSPAIWTLSAAVTFESTSTPVGVRGLSLLTGAGTVLTESKQSALANEQQTVSVSWTGRLPVDPTFYLQLAVKQNQGTAMNLLANTGGTPFRADFTRTPG